MATEGRSDKNTWGPPCGDRSEGWGLLRGCAGGAAEEDFQYFWTLFTDFGPPCENHRGRNNLRCSLDETDASERHGESIEATIKGTFIYVFYLYLLIGRCRDTNVLCFIL